jgi:hypothetical protein
MKSMLKLEKIDICKNLSSLLENESLKNEETITKDGLQSIREKYKTHIFLDAIKEKLEKVKMKCIPRTVKSAIGYRRHFDKLQIKNNEFGIGVFLDFIGDRDEETRKTLWWGMLSFGGKTNCTNKEFELHKIGIRSNIRQENWHWHQESDQQPSGYYCISIMGYRTIDDLKKEHSPASLINKISADLLKLYKKTSTISKDLIDD